VRAVHGMDDLATKSSCEHLRLLQSLVVQRWVRRLGRTGYHVGGAAVSDEEHLALVRLRRTESGLRDCLRTVDVGHRATVVLVRVASCRRGIVNIVSRS
jgi:hypothetical protein